MSAATVEAIFLHRQPSGPMESVEAAEAEAGLGLRDDLYHRGTGRRASEDGPDREITLIEAEAVEAVTRETDIPLTVAESRRNVVTRGVALNPLVGREFLVGDVRLRGIRFCQPCAHLQKLTRPGILKALVDRGGLRAQILEGGTIRVGDAVRVP